MIIDRRTFVLGTAAAGALPAVAMLASPSPGISSDVMQRAWPGQAPVVAREADLTSAVFKIDGWEAWDEPAGDALMTSSAATATNPPTSDRVWISVNRSWRAAWR